MSETSPAPHLSDEQEQKQQDDLLSTPTSKDENELHKEDDVEELAVQPVVESALEPPEGGLRAWLVVLGAFFANWISFGYSNAFGVFYRAYITPKSSFSSAGAEKLGLIGGFSVGFAFLMGPLSNYLVRRFGVRVPVAVGVICMTLGLQLASLANEGAWWQLMLSQGMLFGVGASLVFIPSIALPAQYFVKKRALATGIAASGTSIGALVLAPVTQAVIDATDGTPWALRVIGFITLGLGTLSVLLLQPKTTKGVQYQSFDVSLLKVPGFPTYLIASFLTMLGYATPLFFTSTFCATIGLTGIQSSAIISLIAAGNFIGRLLSGFLADRVGSLNILSTFTIANGLLSILLWQFARSFAAMAVFGIFWGITAGAYWSLAVPVSGKIVGLPKLGSAVSFVFLMNVIPPIISGPIGARILEATLRNMHLHHATPQGYRYVIIFSGLVNILAGALVGVVRLRRFSGWA